MPGTVCTYNGVRIENCLLVEPVKETPVYDQTGRNLLYVTKRLHVRGMVHSHSPITIHGTTVNGSLNSSTISTYRDVASALEQPRCELFFGLNGIALISSNATTDANRGPLPQEVTARVKGQAIEVEFTIECAVTCQGGGNNTGILSNTWSVEDLLDQNMYTTRVWTNVLRVSTIDAGGVMGPHAFRSFVTWPLMPGFEHHSTRYWSTPDGLELHSVVTHKQTSYACPAPATNWSGSMHSISTDEMGITREDLYVHLEGPEDGAEARVRLMGLAAEIAQSITKAQQITSQGGRRLLNARIAYPLDKNAVDLNLSFANTGPPVAFAALTTGKDTRFGLPLNLDGYDRLKAVGVRYYGTATTVGLWAAMLQSPCDSNHGLPQPSGSTTNSNRPNQPSGSIQVDTIEGNAFSLTSTADGPQSNADHLYTYCAVESRFEVDTHMIQIPIARTGAASGGAGQSQDTSVCVPVSQPTARRIFTLHCERIGAWPELPAFEKYIDEGITFTPIGTADVKVASPSSTAEGSTKKLYACKMVLTYAMSRAPTPTDKLYIGSMPWQDMSDAEKKMPSGTVQTSSKIAKP